MTTYYSDNFSAINPATGLEDNTTLDTQKRVDAGIGHGRIRYKRAEFTGTLLEDNTISEEEVVRMMTFKSSDRVIEIRLTSTDAGSQGSISIGLLRTGTAHVGGFLESNIFASGVDITTAALNSVDVFGTGIPDADLVRGKPLWEVVSLPGALSAAAANLPIYETVSYPSDPMEEWDIGIQCVTDAIIVSTTFIVEVLYTSGD